MMNCFQRKTSIMSLVLIVALILSQFSVVKPAGATVINSMGTIVIQSGVIYRLGPGSGNNWSSSDINVATISNLLMQDGDYYSDITSVNPGTTTITSTSSDGTQSTVWTVKVVPSPYKIELTVGQTQGIVDGQQLTLDIAPVLNNNHIFAPLRFIAEATGAAVSWNADTQIITIQKSDANIDMQIGSRILSFNGEPIDMGVTPMIQNGRTLIPMRFVGEALGYEVAEDDAKLIMSNTTIIPPTIVSAEPSNNSTEADVYSDISIKFNETIRSGANFGDITLKAGETVLQYTYSGECFKFCVNG